MKAKTTKIISIMLLSVLIIVTGCTKTTTPTTDVKTTDTSQAESSAAATAQAEDLSPMTLSIFSEDPSPNWNNMQDRVGKEITAKTGITLKAEFAVGDPAQKVALIAASGEYPDLISAKADVAKMVDAGAMLDLTDLIEQYAPNIKKLFKDYPKRLRNSLEDQAIYVIPSWGGVDNKYFTAGGGFEIQHAAVKEANFPKIRTLQDYENVIKAYKDKHPTVDGKPTIGISLNSDDWHMYISVTNPAFYATGGPDDGEYYIDPKTYDAIYHFRRPEEKEYFRWLNHINDIGLLDPESFVQKYDQYKAKVATGRVIGLIDQDWDYGDGEKALKTAGKFELGYGHYPVTLSEEYKDHSFQDTGFMGGWGIGITKSAKDPIRAIKFLDYLASEEAQVLNNWGIKDTDYVIENGLRTIPKAVNDKKINDATNFQKDSGIGLYTNIQGHYGDGVKDATGSNYTTNFPEQIIAGYNDVEKEVLAKYNVKTWKDLFPNESEFPVKPWGAAWNITVPNESEVTVLANKMKDITWKRIPEAILAKPEKFDALWDAYQAALIKADVEKMEKGYSEMVKARVKLWNE
ncbi:extracellular solute-binding protein [Paenibacillus psychroresistens]|uniref:Extracellular solute-binding protein n=1 Tax=Paenibacillus psychroresistens TaxID=1778678 RepID=A0A6B8RR92_9BACL|nr:ABC transporter substrate-binding protein [Paenibacillus psychroresistens]QGQ98911.1 extracellular solute-binding protein [Paenibacillus psychroresistens]